MKTIKITVTNGNAKNGIRGSRITIWDADGNIVDRFVVPARNAQYYCEKYRGGEYGRRYLAALETASKGGAK